VLCCTLPPREFATAWNQHATHALECNFTLTVHSLKF
jgi:hypothetical protein